MQNLIQKKCSLVCKLRAHQANATWKQPAGCLAALSWKQNMHILQSAADPRLEGDGGFLSSPPHYPNSPIKDLCKDIQGCSWNEKGGGELHYPFQWLNLEQNWNVFVVFCLSSLHSHRQYFSGE